MIQWTDAAVNAALHEYLKASRAPLADAMRAALDAAVKAQKEYPGGIRDVTDYMDGMAEGHQDGWNDAIEAAAKVASDFPADTHGCLHTDPANAAMQAGQEISAAIRAIAKTEE